MNDYSKIIIKAVINFLFDAREVLAGFLRHNLIWIMPLSVSISLFLLLGIIYCIVKSSWINRKIEEWMDILGKGDISRRRCLKGWRQILKRVATDNLTNWKLAIAEADRLLDEILKRSGYLGETICDRLNQVAPEVMSNIEQVNKAHQIRDRITQEPDFVISKEEATSVIAAYKKAFEDLGLID